MNIEIHGFPAKNAREIQQRIWGKLIAGLPREDAVDCAVTIAGSIPQDFHARIAPFFRVFSDKKEDFDLVCDFLRSIKMPGAGMHTFVEFILLNGCRAL